MGSVFGKESVKEPSYSVVLRRDHVGTTYELRRYGERFAASVTWTPNGEDDNSSPFGTLAGYIGVFGTAQNEGSKGIAMTAPVVMEREDAASAGGAPESIAMTAPVAMESEGDGKKKMMFMLPEEYDDMSKIPKPTNPRVHIEEIPSEIGAVHRYNGKFSDEISLRIAKDLGAQLASDGVKGITEEYAAEHFQSWGYNPPFTIPYFRRNEVWLKLNDDQVKYLKDTYPQAEGGLPGGSSSTMRGRTKFVLGAGGVLLGAYAVGLLLRSRSQYRRL
jgi:hypothetical protein